MPVTLGVWSSDLSRLAVLIAVCAFLSSIEALVPLFLYQRGRLRRALPNLTLTVAVLLTNLAFASGMAWISSAVNLNHFGLFAPIHGHPWVLLLMGVAGLDFFAYLAHLLLHKIPWGWKFHCVHHSEMEVDVTTAFRQHPGETVWRVAWQCLGIAVFGLPFWIVPIYLSLSGLNAMLEHANIRMWDGVDRWSRLLFVTPNMHKIHHSRRVTETDSNYSNIFSLWDRLCGTHTARADYKTLRYGLDGFDDQAKQALVALMREPFRTS